MKKIILISAALVTVLLVTVFILGCKTTTPAAVVTGISDAMGKDWKLVEVRVNQKNIDFDRKNLQKEGFGEIFTFKIDGSNISGVGAPNRYSAPYTLSAEDPSFITVAVVRSTLMAAINNPEKLREHDYFAYIQNIVSWKITEGKLELRSKNSEDEDVVMLFSL